MPRFSLTIVFSFLIAAALGAGAYFIEGFWQTALIGAATVFLTIAATEALTEYREQLKQPVFYVTLLTVFVALLIGTSLYLFYALLSVTHARPYPLRTGLVANFRSGTGGPARTALDTQCALSSDSAFNLDSLLSYKRIDANSYGAGFLRLSFQLKSPNDVTPYAGIFCSFSYPPEKFFDVSMFRSLKVSMRVPVGKPEFSVRVFLYSRRPEAQSGYEFPSHLIKSAELSADWKEYSIPFYAFRAPEFSNGDVSFDPSAAYRIGFIVYGTPHSSLSAALDLTDIRFSND